MWTRWWTKAERQGVTSASELEKRGPCAARTFSPLACVVPWRVIFAPCSSNIGLTSPNNDLDSG